MKFEKLGTNYAKFTFTITPSEFAHGLDHAFEEIQKDVEVKGFRKGHVPRNIYESKFGVESLYEGALNHTIGHLYEHVFSEESVVIVGDPKVDVDVSKISLDKDFELSLTFPIKPEVTLGSYTGLEVKKRNTKVTQKEINEEINTLLSKNSVLETKDSDQLEQGDTAIIDFEGFLNEVPFEGGKAEGHTLKIGSGQFIPGFEEQLIGMKLHEEKNINVTFPKEYHSEELKGQEVVFKVKLHEIKVEQKEELNDDFVKSLNREGIETVEALKADIKERFTKEKVESEKNRVIGEAVKYAVDNATVDIPMEMIDHEKNNMKKQVESQAKQYGIEFEMYVQFSGMTMEQFDSNLSRQAQEKVHTSLVIEAIAQKEAFAVSDEEIESKYTEISTLYQVDIKEVKSQLSKDVIVNEVRFEKAIDFLEASVVEV